MLPNQRNGCRCVSALGGAGWNEIRRIRLQDDALRIDLGEDASERCGCSSGGETADADETAALDGEVRVAVGAIEAMEDQERQLGLRGEKGKELRLGSALVDHRRQAGGQGQPQLVPEGFLLERSGRTGPEEIETDLADGDRTGGLDQPRQPIHRRGGELVRVPRMETESERGPRVLRRQGKRGLPNRGPVADVHYRGDAGPLRGGADALPVAIEDRIVEMDVGVDPDGAHLTVTLLARLRGRSGSLPRKRAVW